jgi:hypothetical protein
VDFVTQFLHFSGMLRVGHVPGELG